MEKLSILIVDDSQDFKDALNVYLSIVFSHLEIDEAADGTSGYVLMKNKTYDLIITDINMPLLNGYEFISKFRSENDPTKCIVVSSELPDQAFLAQHNIMGYYSKISFNEIAEFIRSTIARAPVPRKDLP